MKHNEQLAHDPQFAARKRQALLVRTGLRVGAEATAPASAAAEPPAAQPVTVAPEAPEIITLKLDDLAKIFKRLGSSA